ncbi:MAG: hypothetical protein AAB681_01825 [Patescibacteria group bacterium]
METENKIYEDINEISSFLNTGNICFYDSYITQGFSVEIDGIKYPSVRHAVLSYKTESVEERGRIAAMIFPSDLKEYEMLLPAPKYWKTDFVLKTFEEVTFRKFMENPVFAEKLDATGNKYLMDKRDKSVGEYDIAELIKIENYDGIVLMRTREKLRKQKTT